MREVFSKQHCSFYCFLLEIAYVFHLFACLCWFYCLITLFCSRDFFSLGINKQTESSNQCFFSTDILQAATAGLTTTPVLWVPYKLAIDTWVEPVTFHDINFRGPASYWRARFFKVTAHVSLEAFAEGGEKWQQKLLPEITFISLKFTYLEVRCLLQIHSQQRHTSIIRRCVTVPQTVRSITGWHESPDSST